MNDVEEITKCRLCDSENIQTVADFGETALANSYLTIEDLANIVDGQKEFKANLSYCFCENCYAYQIREYVSPEKLFSNYLYASSTSGNLVVYFRDYMSELISGFQLSPDDFVVVIASNDGVELRNFVKVGIPCLGIEPAENLAKSANENGYSTIAKFFNEETAEEIVSQYGQASCIVFNNCFAHLSDYKSFVKGLNILLKDNGFAVFENSYLLSVLDNNLFDISYHEHSMQWSLKALKNFLGNYGFQIFDFKQTPPHGGSFRCFIQKKGGYHHIEDVVRETLLNESERYIPFVWMYQNWFRKLGGLKDRMQKFVAKAKEENRSICAYGYPAKATTLCKFMEIGDIFEYVVEDSSFKVGKFTPGYHIPIHDKEWFKAHPTDYCLILAWNFFDLIVENNPDYKGKWINPLNI
jgi:hypothetical protein